MEAKWKASMGVDVVASVVAGLATAAFTYLGLRAVRALQEGAEAEIEFEVEAEAKHAHRPIEESVL